MGTPPEEERFKINVLDLSDLVHELISQCWDNGIQDINPILIVAARAYLKNYDNIDLIETFIKYSHMYWDEIKTRNENFFVEHSQNIFQYLPVAKGNIDAFKMLFTSVDKYGEKMICQEDRDAVWDMFDSLVKICIKYIHRVRECVLEEKDGKMVPRYSKNLFPTIKARSHARKWDIELEIPKA